MTDEKGMIWQSYRYDVFGELTFGKPQYNNVYSYNAESYNPNMDTQYLRARYYSVGTANFLTEDSYLGDITDPLTLNRYNYVKSSPLNYIDPSGHVSREILNGLTSWYIGGKINEKQTSTLLLLLNGLNTYNAFHEIAQVNMAKHLASKGYFSELEKLVLALDLSDKVANASNASRADGCTWQEADIVAARYVWEIKSKNTLKDKQKAREAEKQLENYMKYGNWDEGTRNVFSGLTDIYVLGDVQMDLSLSGIRDGLLQYDFHRPRKEGEPVREVSIVGVKKEYEKRYWDALAVVGGIAAINAIENFITSGIGSLDDLLALLYALDKATKILAGV